ncbi:MAG: hypothetical protein ABIH41_03815 [Nanoarchaeota archaeon]
MKSHEHAIITAVTGSLGLHWLGMLSWQNMLILLIWTVLIDVDHIFYFLFTKEPKTMRSFVSHMKDNYTTKTQRMYLFHTLEFNLLLLWFGFTYPVLHLVLLGALTHIPADQVLYMKHHRNVWYLSKYTATYHIRRLLAAQ